MLSIRTELKVPLPFPVQGIRDESFQAHIPVVWPVVGSPFTHQAVKTTFRVVQHQRGPSKQMELAGWTTHGTGKVTYTRDAHGMFELSELHITVDAHLPSPMVDREAFTLQLVRVINDFLDWHTAQTATLWTPRVTPGDLIAVNFRVLDPDEQVLSHVSLTGGSSPMTTVPVERLFVDDAANYQCVASNYRQDWAAFLLDGLREYMALRFPRSALLGAVGFEFHLNALLRAHGKNIEKLTMRQKGEDLCKEALGFSLNSKKRLGDAASSWMMVLAARNALVHRHALHFDWTDVTGTKAPLNVNRPEDAAAVLCAAYDLVTALRPHFPA